MAENVEALEARIRSWSTALNSAALPPEEIWAMMDDVIDDVMDEFDPWHSFNFGVSERNALSPMNDTGIIPPARYNGVLAQDSDIMAGTIVPNNQEYLRAILIPEGLRRPVDVYLGELSGGVEMSWIGYDEFHQRYPYAQTSQATTTPTPVHYTIFNGTFLLGPTPTFDVKVQAYGVYRPSKIVSGGDTNQFIRESDRLVMYGVLNKLVQFNFEEDTRGGLFNAEFEKAKRKLLSRTRLSNIRAHRVKSRRAGTRWTNQPGSRRYD